MLKAAILLEDKILDYPGYYNCESHCRVRIYFLPEQTIVIVSESETNEGTSVTNMAEGIATLVAYQYELDVKKTIWIEHYPEQNNGRSSLFVESFSLVEFDWGCHYPFPNQRAIQPIKLKASNPQWKHIGKTEVQQLLGIPL
ncbi:hypothetical protein IQ264_01055 [Phormidium sp. LEGE 05292]|uniref:hypothetical protein n=1 Tax=[Phormidium] sp. LEGE 05292 TaxID=767427 RepID=UPI00187E225E|nr:hypothetical protein [Phormidium sp. LEGE 05292]MBE9224063.1 hypothetical protein [Phormidium sp. LEGE 05292]